MKAKWIFQLACIAALVVATLGFSQPVQAGAKDPPDHPGPYIAGFTFKLLYDDAERPSPSATDGARPVPCYVWYPAAPGDVTKMPTALYPFDPLEYYGGLPPDKSTSYEKYGMDPAYQEVPPSKAGPFPLLVFSTGLGGAAEGFYQFGARLASYGFVVVVIPNYGDGALGEPTLSRDDWPYYVWTRVDRELDIKFGITEFIKMNADETSLLYGMINPDQIAVSGHSWGGYAALGVVVPSGDPWFCDAEYEGYPCFIVESDPRIKATLPLDSGSWGLSYEMMTEIKIPHMTINEEWDNLSEFPGGNSTFARQHSAIQGHPNYRVDISQAYHNMFANACISWYYALEIGWIGEELFQEYFADYCYSSLEHAQVVLDLITMYMVAFLKTVLVGDPGYQYFLTPGYALTNEPLAEFFVTEKQNGKPNKPDWPEYFTYFMHQPGSATAQALKDPPKPKMERDLPIMVR